MSKFETLLVNNIVDCDIYLELCEACLQNANYNDKLKIIIQQVTPFEIN